MAGHPRNFWRSLTGHSAAKEDIQLVLDRRQGERRQQVQSVEEERRMADRRGPQTIDLSEVRGFLGEGIHVKGELRFGGAIRLEGYLEGEIVQGEILIIGERGRVNAEVDVGILQVRGEVHGNITASQRVELLGGGRITGTIRTPCLVIWKGAVFNGKCEMPSPQGTQAGGAERNREGGRPPGQA